MEGANFSGPAPQKRFKNANGGVNGGLKRRQPQFSADIVFTAKGGSIQTIPSLIKQLKAVTEPVIGLQYVWEYRSPSKSVPPHYQCKLCQLTCPQRYMLAHVKGWKHCFRYMKRNHPDKVPFEEDAALRDPSVRKTVKEMAAEVEKAEGRGQLCVILKEPSEVPAFQGLRSAIPKMPAPAGPGMGLRGPKPGGRFGDPLFQGDFPPHGGLLSDYPLDLGMGGYSDPLDRSSPGRPFAGGDAGLRHFPDDLRLGGGQDGFGHGGGREGFGSGGLMGESPGRRYPDEFRGGQVGNSPGDRPGLMGAAPEGSCPFQISVLLKYLDSFRIENFKVDLQIVLKVTQKLEDVLEYRLRSVSSGGPGLKSNSPQSSMGSYSSSSRMPSSVDHYSGNLSGNQSVFTAKEGSIQTIPSLNDPEGSSLPSVLLKYLDSFRIENVEVDKQMMLKVTQKLTDVLMEYRLRSVSSGGPGLKSNSPQSSMGSYSSSSRMPSSVDHYSGNLSGNQSGPSRFSDGPSRSYN